MRSTPIVLALAFAMAGCVGTDADQGMDPAANAAQWESVPIEHPVSVDLVIPFYVYYSTVASDHCASEIVKLDGPIIHVDVTATWEAPVPETLVLRVYNGTEGREVVTGHEEEAYRPRAAEEGPSPLTLDADVAVDDTVRLRLCQRDNLVVPHDVDVHLEGTIHYLPQMPAAT